MSDFSIQPLIEAWGRATEDIKRQVEDLAATAAVRAEATVRVMYPRRTGRLVKELRVRIEPGSQGSIPLNRVRVTAPHVHFVEEGTKARFDSTRGNARRGVMPGIGQTFVPIVVAEREQYLRQAQALLEQDREVI